jgi:hypothetical protein
MRKFCDCGEAPNHFGPVTGSAQPGSRFRVNGFPAETIGTTRMGIKRPGLPPGHRSGSFTELPRCLETLKRLALTVAQRSDLESARWVQVPFKARTTVELCQMCEIHMLEETISSAH